MSTSTTGCVISISRYMKVHKGSEVSFYIKKKTQKHVCVQDCSKIDCVRQYGDTHK